MSVTLSKHIHEYERSKANKDIYRCIHPRCTHYHNREFLVGKEALCPMCHNAFILDWKQLKNKRPRCEFCRTSTKSQNLRNARKAAIAVLNELPIEIKSQILNLETNEQKNGDEA
jgi:hypothetical protein